VAQPCQQSPQDIDPRLGFLPPSIPSPVIPSPFSHEVGVQPPLQRQQSLAIADPQLGFLPSQQSLPNMDPRLDFLPPYIPSTVSCEVGFRPPSETASSTPLPLIQVPSFIQAPLLMSVPQLAPIPPLTLVPAPPGTNLSSNLGDSDSEGSDADIPQTHELDIDKRSDDEDDRTTHQLLRAVEVETPQTVTSDSPILSYGHQGFSVG
jgi:hypothetical protein